MYCLSLVNVISIIITIKCVSSDQQKSCLHQIRHLLDANQQDIGNCHQLYNQYPTSMAHKLSHQMVPDLSIKVITWNVKSEQCKCDLSQLVDIAVPLDGQSTVTTGTANSPLADMYVIGLQEVAFRPTSLLFTDPWVDSFDQLFKQLDYVRLKQIRLVGILLIVYTHRQKLPNFRSIETQYTRTGFGGLWGNKGGVSVSLIVDGVSLCLVNTHLAPHDHNLEQRISDYNTIVDGQYFSSDKKPNILSHDYVLWMGDLNFRIDDLTADEILDIILNAQQTNDTKCFAQLLDKDQLNHVRLEGLAFSEFTETPPTFSPTYKFIVNTDNYDYRARKPAYTDRILYRYTANSYDNIKLDLKQYNYKWHPLYKQSDHKPVSTLFHLKTKRSVRRLTKRMALGVPDSQVDSNEVDSDRQIYITFHPITNWKVNRDSTAWYTITPNDRPSIESLSPWDWIGLYKSDFLSIDELLSYVWANPVPTRWSPPDPMGNNSDTDGGSDDTVDAQSGEPWFSVHYLDQTLLVSDQFRLVYVTQNGDVLGISEPFLITS